MKRTFLLSLFCVIVSISFAQKDSTVKRLQKKLQDAKSINAKLDVIYELAVEYNLENPKACQETLDQGIVLAEESRDREMMIKSIRQAANVYLQNIGIKAYADKAADYAKRAIAMCKKEPGLINENVYCNMLMARFFRNTNNYLEAEKYNQVAIAGADETNNDSLKVVARVSHGNTQLVTGNKLDAFKSYLTAQTIAEKSKQLNKGILQSIAYNSLSSFYSTIEDYDRAIDFLYKSLDYAKKTNNVTDIFTGLSTIGRNYLAAKKYANAKNIYEEIIKQADTLKKQDYKTTGQIGIVNTLISSDNPKESLTYLKEHGEIKELFQKINMEYSLDFGLAQIYTAMKQYDSANYYFNKSMPLIEKTSSASALPSYYVLYAGQLFKSATYTKAITYLLKAKAINDSLGNSMDNKDCYEMLDSCYQKTGDFKNAFLYSSKFQKVKAELDEKGKSKDILAAEIDAENKRKERLEKEETEETNRRHNWQYMGIIVSIITLFMLLAGLGFFSVPIKWIRALGFISFIFLFEFIILLADNWIHHATHGEPWKVLSIKVVLIAVLLPLHHFLEEKVIHYIVHRKQNKINTNN